MSEEVETTPVPPAEILPAKSEDKLIIEKEEKESEQQDQAPEDKPEEKAGEEEKGTKTDDEEKPDNVDNENEVEEDKKVEAPEEKGDEDKEGNDDGKEPRSRKKFKMPNVELKAPKVPGFIRAISKERKKVRTVFIFIWLDVIRIHLFKYFLCYVLYLK